PAAAEAVARAQIDDRGEWPLALGQHDLGAEVNALALVLDVDGELAARDTPRDVRRPGRLLAVDVLLRLRQDLLAAAAPLALLRDARAVELGEGIGQL